MFRGSFLMLALMAAVAASTDNTSTDANGSTDQSATDSVPADPAPLWFKKSASGALPNSDQSQSRFKMGGGHKPVPAATSQVSQTSKKSKGFPSRFEPSTFSETFMM